MRVSIRKTGFDLDALSRRLKASVADELNDTAQDGVTLAKQLAPVKTGFMRDHITQIEEATPERLRVAVESQADYSSYVEFGTITSSAQPFMTPTYEMMRSRAIGMAKTITILR